MDAHSKIFKEIRSMCDKSNLPKAIMDRTKKLFKKVHAEKILKGYSHSGVASACLYISCRREGAARSSKEIHAVSKSSVKEIKKCFQLISKILKTSVGTITSASLISRFCSTLGLPVAVDKAATHIAQKAAELDIVPGRSPMSVAAAAIYMASQASKDNVKKTLKEIGAVAGVHAVTIRESYKMMRSWAPDLFPEDCEFTFPIAFLPDL